MLRVYISTPVVYALMYPYIDIFGKNIPSYSLLGGAGVILGMILIIALSRIHKVDVYDSIELFTFGLIGAVVGAKILYLIINIRGIISNADDIKGDLFSYIYSYIAGGMVFYGGLFGVIALTYFTSHWLKIDIKEYYSSLIPGFVLFASAGRIGCFLTGCCYGVETDSAHGVMFQLSEIAPHGVYLIPTQLYESGFDLILVVLLIIIGFCFPHVNQLKVYLYLYAVFRFILEFFRGDRYRAFFLSVSTSQWISVLLIVTLVILEVRKVVRERP